MGVVAPTAQEEVRVCVAEPICPGEHADARVSEARGVHATVVTVVGAGVIGAGDAGSGVGAGVVVCEAGAGDGLEDTTVEELGGTPTVDILHSERIAVRVIFPTMPYPVVCGVPEQRFMSLHWNCFTAASVMAP